MRIPAIHAALFLSFSASIPVPGAEVRLDGDRMTLRADDERLRGVLEEFVRAGVEVQIEPGIDAMVNGALEDEAINDGLDQLLGHFNYVLFWRRIDGPLGPLTRLSGMHIFRPGRQREVAPFAPSDPNFDVVTTGGLPPHVRDELLLGVKPGTTAKQFKEMLGSLGATAVDSVAGFGIYRVRLPRDSNVAAVGKALQGNPWVAVVEPNYVHRIPAPVPGLVNGRVPPPSPSPGKPAPGAAAVAVFDSGLSEIEALADAVVGSYDAVDPTRPISDPVGHGTQMALIAAGAVLPHGVPADLAADPTPVLAIRSFDDHGRASNYSLLRGIEYAIAEGARVISMSWGTETDSEFLHSAIRYAQDHQMIIVASAGNEPINRPVYPAAYGGVLAVSALEADGTIWPQSNYGDFLFAAAPGTGEFPVGYEGPPGAYAGTSIASPTVARALTLYLTAHPDASAADAVQALQAALTDIGDPGRDPYSGYGALDAQALDTLLGAN